MNRNVVAAAVVALAAVLGLYMALSRPEPIEQPKPDAPTAPPRSEPAAPAPPPPTPPPAAPQVSHTEPEAPPPPAAVNEAIPQSPEVKPPVRSGPLDELKKTFQTEPRASAAHDLESYIESEFKKPNIPNGLFRSALCRTNVCKVQVRWQPDRNTAYGIAFMAMLTTFELSVGVDPDVPDKNNEVLIDVYLQRRAVPIVRNVAPPPEPER